MLEVGVQHGHSFRGEGEVRVKGLLTSLEEGTHCKIGRKVSIRLLEEDSR